MMKRLLSKLLSVSLGITLIGGTVSFLPVLAPDTDISVNAATEETPSGSYTYKENTSTVANDEINLGNTIDVFCSATGGTAPYQYAVFYKQTSQTKWTCAQSYNTITTVSITPKEAGTYTVRVKAKDAEGTVVNKDFKVTVRKADKLINTSAIDKTTAFLGGSFKATCAASGGKKAYKFAVYYKQDSKTSWTCVQGYGINTSVTITPKAATTYTIRVKAKDAEGTVVNKDFKVTVCKADKLINTSAIEKTTASLGDCFKVACAASGGKKAYKFAVYYKQDRQTSWTCVQGYGVNTSVTITPKAATTYTIRVKAKDADENVVNKDFKVAVNKTTESKENVNESIRITINTMDLVDGYITTSGNVSTSSNYKRTWKIFCQPGDVFSVKNQDAAIIAPFTIAPYNNDQVLTEYIAVNNTDFTAPDNANYLILSFSNSRLDGCTQLVITRTTPRRDYKTDSSLSEAGKAADAKAVGDALDKCISAIPYNYYDKKHVQTKTNGGVWQKCPDIPVEAGQEWRIMNSDLSLFKCGTYITFYKSDNTTTTASNQNVFTIPADVVKMSILCRNSTDTAFDLLITQTELFECIQGYYDYGVYAVSPDYIIPEPKAIEYFEKSRAKPYYGKRILSLGDSYTCKNYYGKYLAEATGTTQRGRGQNGNMLMSFCNDTYNPVTGGTVSEPFDADLLSDYDIVTIMGGTNDYGHGTATLGTIDDEIGANTIYGSVKYLINKILSIKPDMKIFFCTQPFRLHYSTEPAPGGYEANSNGLTMENIADAICDCCKHYGIPCFDFYHCSNWNSYTVRMDENGSIVSNIYTNDGLHPKDGNGNGADLLGTSFGEFINQHII